MLSYAYLCKVDPRPMFSETCQQRRFTNKCDTPATVWPKSNKILFSINLSEHILL